MVLRVCWMLVMCHIDIIEFLESVPNNFLANKLELISKVKQRLESQAAIPEMPEAPENLGLPQ